MLSRSRIFSMPLNRSSFPYFEANSLKDDLKHKKESMNYKSASSLLISLTFMTLSKKRTNVARKQRERNEMCMKFQIHFWYCQDNPPFLTPNHIFLDFTSTYFPWSLASSRSWRNESFFSRSFRCFSRLSSSARSLTYCSNTCFLSLDVRSK